MATATLARKPKCAKAPKPALVIVGREISDNVTSYYIQSGENVYVPRIQNGVACGCTRLNGDACEAYLYSARTHKTCKHVELALANEQERASDLKQHVHDELHSCLGCGYRVKRANSYCHKCS